MVHFRPQAREIIVKVVYYGPPLGGKTTNLRTLYQGYPASTRGELVVVPAGGDRTIFFDFLPMDAGQLRGMRLRVQLYTVPGQVHYNATRQVVLRGVDGVVFVADSQRELMRSNKEAWDNLKENLALQGLALTDLPHVLQYNKRDIAGVVELDEMDQLLNEFSSPFFEAVASQGIGVEETLQGVVKLVARSLRERFRVGAETGLPGLGELTLTPPSSLDAPPAVLAGDSDRRVFAFAPSPPPAALADLDEVFAVPLLPEPAPRADEVTQKVKVTPIAPPETAPLPPLDDPFGESPFVAPAAVAGGLAHADDLQREDDVFELERPPAPSAEPLAEEPLEALGAETLLPEFAVAAPPAPAPEDAAEPELAFEAPHEVEVPPVAVELPQAGVAAAIQRVVPRALAQYGEVRELELEVPVPAVWVGGKRMTLQLRLTLVPQEDEHGG